MFFYTLSKNKIVIISFTIGVHLCSHRILKSKQNFESTFKSRIIIFKATYTKNTSRPNYYRLIQESTLYLSILSIYFGEHNTRVLTSSLFFLWRHGASNLIDVHQSILFFTPSSKRNKEIYEKSTHF